MVLAKVLPLQSHGTLRGRTPLLRLESVTLAATATASQALDERDDLSLASFLLSNDSDLYVFGSDQRTEDADGNMLVELPAISLFGLSLSPRLFMECVRDPDGTSLMVNAPKGEVVVNGRPLKGVEMAALNTIRWTRQDEEEQVQLTADIELRVTTRIAKMNRIAFAAWKAAGNAAVGAACRREARSMLRKLQQGYIEYDLESTLPALMADARAGDSDNGAQPNH